LKRYLPGPHCGSASGRYKENALTSVGLTTWAVMYSALFRPSVLSRKTCLGKPVAVGVTLWLDVSVIVVVCDADRLGVRAEEAVADLVTD